MTEGWVGSEGPQLPHLQLRPVVSFRFPTSTASAQGLGNSDQRETAGEGKGAEGVERKGLIAAGWDLRARPVRGEPAAFSLGEFKFNPSSDSLLVV